MAVDHLLILRDWRVDAGAAFGIDELSWRSGSEPAQK